MSTNQDVLVKQFRSILKFDSQDSFKIFQRSLANLVSNLQPSDFKNISIIKSNVSLLTKKLFILTIMFHLSINYLKKNFHQNQSSIQNSMMNLKSDVLLLADVFENFRKTCLKHYNLDPAHNFTSPGFAWNACLKETGHELQLLHDYDMLMLFEKGIRGGITHISKLYAEANNKYMSDFNPDLTIKVYSIS